MRRLELDKDEEMKSRRELKDGEFGSTRPYRPHENFPWASAMVLTIGEDKEGASRQAVKGWKGKAS
ncbi:hypothetical protein F2Q69_00022819 [Brassica cretica]|uniref:Uncharacterized protein n=1 Tax=Brassica cretica TaxID=69181 RepID=A0A3N6S517_BRACR|nr:hypothetical protein F2Q69_00022819 [Brassica cretica]